MYWGWYVFPIFAVPAFLVSSGLAFLIERILKGRRKQKSNKRPNLSRAAAVVGIAAIIVGSAAFAYGVVSYLESLLTLPLASPSESVFLMVFGLAVGLAGGILLGVGDWSVLQVFSGPPKTPVSPSARKQM